MFGELGDIYELISESYRGVEAPISSPKLSFRDNKIGTATPDLYASSEAGLVPFGNPYEQEETAETIKKSDVFKLIESLSGELDQSPTDRVAHLTLSKLKKALQKL